MNTGVWFSEKSFPKIGNDDYGIDVDLSPKQWQYEIQRLQKEVEWWNVAVSNNKQRWFIMKQKWTQPVDVEIEKQIQTWSEKSKHEPHKHSVNGRKTFDEWRLERERWFQHREALACLCGWIQMDVSYMLRSSSKEAEVITS